MSSTEKSTLKASAKPLNPKTVELDFFGIPGATFISVTLPIFLNIFHFATKVDLTNSSNYVSSIAIAFQTAWPGWSGLLNLRSVYAYLLWFGALVVLDRVLPGKEVEGVELRDGKKLKYKMNGRLVMITMFVAIVSRWWITQGAMPEFVFIYDNMLELTNAASLFSFLIAVYVYLVSFLPQPKGQELILATGGNSGNIIFDWFIGRELNPRIGEFDIKVFCEMRPGLLLWVVINMAMAHHQYLAYGAVSYSMWLVLGFQVFYVIEGNWNEEGLLQMMDVTTDGFGFMLAIGDLSWVPFSYTLQARFLADKPVQLPTTGIMAILVINFVGYYIFRSANDQKSAFKRGDDSAKSLSFIQTPTGSKLITSGWWGRARHINYFGDWLMAWAWCLPTGFSNPFTYFYVVYFGILLVHRERRDEAKCADKYKETWTEYKKLVPSRIIPGLY
ncbi:ERG4/ERG24 ergosterol biosynthesis protein [Nadsonia fulvescens var. elongata DSM 6958]|uniref:Delta(14)-sterol reductase n=1 Tax=Nadsonia fulvescens var. elongata DSM 6958 TaxID=857566 RepID=A0A1E3PD45_9ASCO|nr:ERG4/ERG24 ergosterol biosynthesis protein [Nadsonia fulvescens var. elongata DSM 6958]